MSSSGKSGQPLPLVLCVDDDPAVLRAYARLFSAWGARVISAGHLAGARHELARLGLPPDLVVLDLHLPDGLGSDLLPELKRLTPPPLVAIVSAAALVNVALADRVLSKSEGIAPLRALLATAAGALRRS